MKIYILTQLGTKWKAKEKSISEPKGDIKQINILFAFNLESRETQQI